MPRKPTSSHPIRELRQILDVGQAQFASRIGISTSALQRIELHALKLSDEIASRIHALTGVETGWLYGRDVAPGLTSEEIQKTFRKWDKVALSKASERFLEFLVPEIQKRIRCLLEAAHDLRRLPFAEIALWRAMDSIAEKLGLEKAAHAKLKASEGLQWAELLPPSGIFIFTEAGKHEFSADATLGELAEYVKSAPEDIGIGFSRGVRFTIARDEDEPSSKLPISKSPSPKPSHPGQSSNISPQRQAKPARGKN